MTPSIIDLFTSLLRTSFYAEYPCTGLLNRFSCLGLATTLRSANHTDMKKS